MKESRSIGFIGYTYFEDGACLRGGILVTDEETKPQAFHATDAIRPTRLQKLLYGDIMESFILTNLVGLPLLRAAQVKPSLCLIDNKQLLAMRPRLDIPVIWIAKHGEGSADKSASESQLLTSRLGSFEPVLLMSHREHIEDVANSKAMLEEVFGSKDLVEPFERVRSALSLVHDQQKAG
jgi:hypothetical protein